MSKIVRHRLLSTLLMLCVSIPAGHALVPVAIVFLRFPLAINKCQWQDYLLLTGMLAAIALTYWSCKRPPGRIQWGVAIALFCAVIAGVIEWWASIRDYECLITAIPFLYVALGSLFQSYEGDK